MSQDGLGFRDRIFFSSFPLQTLTYIFHPFSPVSDLKEEDANSDAESDSASALSGSKKSALIGGTHSGQIISLVKEACRKAFQAQPQRLMCSMYSCNIQATAQVLGKSV